MNRAKKPQVATLWLKHRNRSKKVVCLRAGWMCEASDCNEVGVDGAHAFGRGHLISEPLASLPCFMFWLCRECHNRMDVWDKPFQTKMRWIAIERALEVLNVDIQRYDNDVSVGAARRIEAIWKPPLDLEDFYV